MDELMEIWMDGGREGRMDKWRYGWMDRGTDGGVMEKEMDGWRYEWTDGWMNNGRRN